jgi:hypothetical protein
MSALKSIDPATLCTLEFPKFKPLSPSQQNHDRKFLHFLRSDAIRSYLDTLDVDISNLVHVAEGGSETNLTFYTATTSRDVHAILVNVLVDFEKTLKVVRTFTGERRKGIPDL